ncbi:uncharacterized protein LOC111273954 isoform X2 [Varroa jacobsoni]|uniref:uncharacterized protein LOC111273954 isoform X2 n=1 Tax=Varroa jacobsoni TaxID=62625 RepID=UPI000BF7215F|nr:uncharacterized protein LOC111273954 isoform X2 [Varroa jacobsoni]
MKILLIGLIFVGAAYTAQLPVVAAVMKDATANEEKKMFLANLSEPQVIQKDQITKAEPQDPMELAVEPTAEESAPKPVIIQKTNTPLDSVDVPANEYAVAEDPEIEKLAELPFDIDSVPETKNPDDPCRRIRDLTTRWRELGREIAQRTAELVRVRGEERQKVRDQIRRIREDMSKTNTLIRENTRECARTRRPTLRPIAPEKHFHTNTS